MIRPLKYFHGRLNTEVILALYGIKLNDGHFSSGAVFDF